MNMPQDPILITLSAGGGPHYIRHGLSNFTNHAFQVIGLQAGRSYWMIGGRAALLNDANIAARFLRHAGEHERKIFATHAASATTGKEDSAPLQ